MWKQAWRPQVAREGKNLRVFTKSQAEALTGWQSRRQMGEDIWGDRVPAGSPLTHTVIPHLLGFVLGLFSDTLSDNPPNSPTSVRRELCLHPHLTDEEGEARKS